MVLKQVSLHRRCLSTRLLTMLEQEHAGLLIGLSPHMELRQLCHRQLLPLRVQVIRLQDGVLQAQAVRMITPPVPEQSLNLAIHIPQQAT